jgi:hypothetical protein
MDVQDILKRLEVNEGTFPREAVAQAVAQREAIIPELLRILEYAYQNIEHLIDKGYMAHIYAMYLLAQFRETRAYSLIVQFFSMPGEIMLDVTGDVVTEDLGRILASVCCGETDLIASLAENEQANEYVRNAALRSLVILVACGDLPRDDVITYFQSLFRRKLVRKHSYVWDGLVSASTVLYPEEVYEDIKQAYRAGLIDPFSISLENVEQVLSRGKEHALNRLHSNAHFALIDDTIREMEWWVCFQPKDRPSHTVIPAVQPRTVMPNMEPSTKKPQQKAKDKRKRKLAKASRRKNRR